MAGNLRPLFIYLVCLTLAATPLAAAAPSGPDPAIGRALTDPQRVAGWREDMDLLAREFPRKQHDFAKLYNPQAFAAELARLKADLPTLSNADIFLRLSRLVASGGLSHNEVAGGVEQGFRRLPLRFGWYDDGLFIDAAGAGFEDLTGARVVLAGEGGAAMTPRQILSALSPYLAHDNDDILPRKAQSKLTALPIWRALGLTGDDAALNLDLVLADGQAARRSVTALAQIAPPLSLPSFPGPGLLARSRPGSPYWFQDLPQRGAIYVQYNVCGDDPAEPFSRFVDSLSAALAANPSRRLVIDLRFNGGGNSLYPYRLMRALAGVKSRGPVVGLIGPGTFSSGVDAAIYLRDILGAPLIGAPAGDRPNTYGNVATLVLPHSQIGVRYTTAYNNLVGEDGRALSLAGGALRSVTGQKIPGPPQLIPDLRVATTHADLAAGRDAVLEAALDGIAQR